MPRTKATSSETLCVNFCTYYKPGRNEELECQGSVAVRRLIDKGRALSQERPRTISVPDPRVLEELKGRVCSVCSFREAHWDYAASVGVAEPCGGFVLLSHLLGTGDLKVEEIE